MAISKRSVNKIKWDLTDPEPMMGNWSRELWAPDVQNEGAKAESSLREILDGMSSILKNAWLSDEIDGAWLTGDCSRVWEIKNKSAW